MPNGSAIVVLRNQSIANNEHWMASHQSAPIARLIHMEVCRSSSEKDRSKRVIMISSDNGSQLAEGISVGLLRLGPTSGVLTTSSRSEYLFLRRGSRVERGVGLWLIKAKGRCPCLKDPWTLFTWNPDLTMWPTRWLIVRQIARHIKRSCSLLEPLHHPNTSIAISISSNLPGTCYLDRTASFRLPSFMLHDACFSSAHVPRSNCRAIPPSRRQLSLTPTHCLEI